MEIEESKGMLKAQQPTPSSALEIDEEALPARESSPPAYQRVSRPVYYDDNKPTIRGLYGNANLCAAFRCLLTLPILGAAAYILSIGPSPTVLPFAAYSLTCASLHALLIAHRAVKPRSRRNALPPLPYMVALMASPALLLAAFVYGLVVISQTKVYFDQRDPSRIVDCGKRTGPKRPCHPKTPDADAFDFTIICVAFAFAALLCSLVQCYYMFLLSLTSYTQDEIETARDSVGKATFSSIMKEQFAGWFQRAAK